MRKVTAALFFSAFVLNGVSLPAAEPEPPAPKFAASEPEAPAQPEPKLFDGLWQNVVDSFTGMNLFWHAAGFTSTGFLVKAGSDAHVYDSFRKSENEMAIPGAVLGSGAGAVIAGGSLYYSGVSSNNKESILGAFAIAQASLITSSYVMFLKITTGRARPTNTWHLTPQEQSEQFQFGFFRNGLTSYGWPSGHVSHTVAVMSALAHFYPHKRWLVGLGAGLSAYMLYTVSAYDSGQMHWFSDGVAGGFMGYAIGSTVGKNFRKRIEGVSAESTSLNWLPVLGSGYFGAVFSMEY